MKPFVTVVIPTYYRPKKLSFTIHSVLKQTFENIEIIVVNDGEDELLVKKVIEEFNDKRIRYLKNQKTKGANGARNTGLENSKGKYIAFLDDDDLWYPHKIQKQLEVFNQSSNLGFVYSGFEIISPADPHLSKKIFPQKKGQLYNEIINGNFIGSPTPLIKKKVLYSAGAFDENLKSCQDWELWIRIATITQFDFVNEILAVYTVHGKQISIDYEEKVKSFDYVLNKYKNLFNANKKAFAKLLKRTAVLYMLNGKIKKCRERLVQALAVNGLRIDLVIHLLFSLFPKLYRKYIYKFIMVECNGINLIY